MKNLTLSLIITLFTTTFSTGLFSAPIDFIVTNNTDSHLIELQISSNNHSWAAFDAVDLKAQQSATFIWEPSPLSSCIQYIRGKFSTGEWSTHIKIDFCSEPKIQVTFSP